MAICDAINPTQDKAGSALKKQDQIGL